MVQMWLLWWPKSTITTATVNPNGAAADATDTSVPESGSCCCITAGSSSSTTTTTSSSSCSCLSKLVRKLKKHCRSLRAAAVASPQRPFQCRYDPLSYSLNFDTSGCGNLLEDGDYYYQFCAFSSRYVGNPRTSSSPKMVAAKIH